MRMTLLVSLLGLSLAAPVWAQGTTPLTLTAPPIGTPAAPSPPAQPAPKDNDATEAYKSADHAMMMGMDRPMTGDPDQDFVAGMIPHHQGAVAMAKVELRYGKDPALKHLARQIIAAQNHEIAFMKSWQHAHPAAK